MRQQSEQEAALDRLLRRVGTTTDVPLSGDCLDPETVAAMMEAALLPHEQSAAEAHASTCPRCQELLAAVVRSAPEPAPVRAWWRIRGGTWLMPAAAATLVGAVWVSLEVQPGRAPAVPVVVTIPGGNADSRRVEGGATARQVREKGTAPEARTAREPAAAAKTSPSLLPQEFATATPPEEAALDRPAAAESGARRSASAPETPGPQSQAAATAAENATLSRNAARDTVRNDASPASGAAAPRARTGLVVREITSPDPRSRWRIIGSSVQRSVDEGRTWSTQATGTTSWLTAGSAPQPDVCWIVGEDGLVLRTVDGLSWQRVKAPADVPLVSVRATSAQAATITTTDGRSFVTGDGGGTWAPR